MQTPQLTQRLRENETYNTDRVSQYNVDPYMTIIIES